MESENHTTLKQRLKRLALLAISLGATSSQIISSKEIQSKDDLAALCNGEYTCPNYGLAAGCPPYVEGPFEFRKWQALSTYSIAVKIELPTSVMFSDQRNDVMKLLHRIVAEVECKAATAGFSNSKGFAGGSCKKLFCENQEYCCVIKENKTCPHTESARPSISGFGIDAVELMKSSGWDAKIADKLDTSDSNSQSWVVGLILIA